jgi:hypothetical protein
MFSGALGRAAFTAVGLVAVSASQAASVDLKFARIEPHNLSYNPASQLNVRVSDVSGNPGQVTFRVTNAVGSVYSSVTEIYFDSHGSSPLGQLLSPVSNSSGVQFTGGTATPGALPGGASLANPFVATAGFSADAASLFQGIDSSSKWVEMTFNLTAGKTFTDVLAAINNQDLRLGLRSTSILAAFTTSNSFSDSFINTIVAVPLPVGVWSGFGVLGGIAIFRWRRVRRA